MKFNKFEAMPELYGLLRLPYKLAPERYWKGLDVYNRWIAVRKPFYRVYPGFIDCINRINFDKIPDKGVLPVDAVEICLPANIQYDVLMPTEFGLVSCIVTSFLAARREDKWTALVCCHSEENPDRILNCSLPDLNDSLLKEPWYPLPLRIMRGLQLIAEDSELIRPIPFKKDLEKWKASGDMKYIDKARRNGVYGWSIGEAIPTSDEIAVARERGELREGSKSPHYRSGTFGLRWTGTGRSEPKIVRIKESWVNWDKVKTVPTGYRED